MFVAVDSLSCFKLASHLNREYMACQIFIVMKIMLLYCSVTCFLVICFVLFIVVCESHCCLSFAPPAPSPFFLNPVISNLCSVLILLDHIEQWHSNEEHFSYICIFYIQSSRKTHNADNYEAGDEEEHITVFSTEKHFEVKSGSLEHLCGRSSGRYVSAIVLLLLLLLLLFYTGR
jgi:hypothetical protein